MTRLQSRPATDVLVATRGEVSLAAPEYARTKLLAVLERLDEPVLTARVKLTQEANHAVARPSIAQATLDLNGRRVRAHVAATTMQEAVDLLQDRLNARIARLRTHRHHRHHAAPSAAARHEHRPQRRALGIEERRIVRHKTYSLARQTTWAAVFELEAMDHDFHLYTDAVTGCDSVVHHDGTTEAYRITSAGPAPEAEPGIAVSAHAVPGLTVAEAVSRLDLSGLPFVFFTNTETGRGNVLYHRYDGHYGLITPAD
ncbi:HPF/RaiA family ribosome-associated protein [Streptomyces kaniharaensis]|uniref:HPF/RaiA family ribosome-associated protein n=1 Tax=Streptomyces kaniharaensis TaxID=212423 RepID=A0A6N7L3H3_9ACTN|nr:HPF/RaiA family ribosome-associated protein [Streptomyces kaniharaensis]MQS17098.1 HPF/RaiA family ribosome-associated protein [Streptomyces kaniharaensis]